MATSASKRSKEDDRRKKEKVQEEKEAAKRLKEETAEKKDELVEMLQNARISRRYSVKGSAPEGNGKPHHKSSKNGGICPQLQVKKRSLRLMWRLADSRYQLPPRKEKGCEGG